MAATILGIHWRQGYGFDASDVHLSTWRTHQAAYGRVRRAQSDLRREGLDDWAIDAKVTAIVGDDGRKIMWLLRASLYEIQ